MQTEDKLRNCFDERSQFQISDNCYTKYTDERPYNEAVEHYTLIVTSLIKGYMSLEMSYMILSVNEPSEC